MCTLGCGGGNDGGALEVGLIDGGDPDISWTGAEGRFAVLLSAWASCWSARICASPKFFADVLDVMALVKESVARMAAS